ncbi:hypothetical protein [Nonomuraea guangzhouensis]|uniref:Uncharacterized protein n=1 Tax=Nonomuraea guangzhouensis TaxID=1291555 RepID=A0ABW4GVY2_9ACTN|nr:hypothetical protein [Nonomuraea guangzhouensis]
MSLRVTCDQEVLTTFHARIAIDHKDGLFADWYEVDHDYYEQLPGHVLHPRVPMPGWW